MFRNGPNGDCRKEKLRSSFSLILENLVPEELQTFLTVSENPLKLDWNEMSKIPKMLRFHWNHFKQEKEVSQFEEFVAFMKLKKREHKNFIKNVVPKLLNVRISYQK